MADRRQKIFFDESVGYLRLQGKQHDRDLTSAKGVIGMEDWEKHHQDIELLARLI